MDVVTRAWTREERDLWQRLTTHPFEDPEIDLDFTRRLARTLGWSLETARAGIEEYRRFCFLACVTTGAPVTPSEEVDEIWHLHLTYTRDYWERWCGEVLRRGLHHDPTAGGPVEQSRYRAQYAETLALYERHFGAPPAAFWPGTAKRFAARPRYRMIDGDAAIVLPRPSRVLFRRARVPGLAALLALVTTPASASEFWNPLDMTGSDFLALYVILLGTAAVLTLLLRTFVLETGRPADAHGLSSLEIAYINGGMTRAADTLFVALAAQKVASHADKSVTIKTSASGLGPEIERFRRELVGTHVRKSFLARFASSAAAEGMLAGLARRNIVLDAKRQTVLAFANTLPALAVLGLGVTKIFVGLSRGRPVLFLVLLCVLTVIVLTVFYFRERYLTTEGRAAVAALRARVDRAIRAPRSDEIALAFAFTGVAALTGTEHAAYAKMVQPPSGSSGCSSGSGCSGGGGGCGGGGCGGCSS